MPTSTRAASGLVKGGGSKAAAAGGGAPGTQHAKRASSTPRLALIIVLLAVTARYLVLRGNVLNNVAANTASGFTYSIMIDCGSTGSRLHVYAFERQTQSRLTLRDEVFLEVKPGLSAFSHDSAEHEKEAVHSHLRPLLERARDEVPDAAEPSTSVEIRATAGLRLLGAEKSQRLLDACEKLLREYPFRLPSSTPAAQVMPDRDEGPFAWLTVNFLRGVVGRRSAAADEDDESTSRQRRSTAIREDVDVCDKHAMTIDMGGASTQIVFQPTPGEATAAVLESEASQKGGHAYSIQLHEDVGGGDRLHVYQHSHLGYGLMEAQKKIAKLGGASTAFPCFPQGYKHKGFEATNVEAKANFDKCLPFAEKILNKDAPCSWKSCSFNGVFQPSLKDAFSGPIYAFSYFYDRMEPFLRADGVSSVGQLKEVGTKVCDGTEAPYSEHAKGTMCMDFAYLYALLHTGYDLPDETPLYIRKKISGVETSWSLGAALLTL